ncbi:DUF2726 domain-containing protein (plasmid) [Sinorhizobium medicae WSM1115]|uniref:DUF2726 domain-containing protein n=1 Tax=Sinorhizobium medicae TaxID=110321 RepID=UPI00037B3CF6|nr:DUF2726 domain-containing protein [Sinorhizobium medicae]UFX06559.1 DUF2726 domain-containing protein [Sinorhizobium medicae WSM1115]
MHYRSQRRSVLFTAPGLVVGALAVGAVGGISVSPGDILALVEKPHLLVAVLFVGAFTGIMVEQALTRMRRQAWRARNRSRWEKQRSATNAVVGPWAPRSVPESSKRPDATEQLRIVMNSTFTIQPLLNRSEARVFKELDRLVIGCNPAWQAMAQVSLGEILPSKDADAYSCINAKRVDLLLVDGNCRPRHVVEYQGGAHHQGAAAARDAVKKEALRRAGIGYYEVVAGQTTPSDLRRLVEKLVEKPELPICAPD